MTPAHLVLSVVLALAQTARPVDHTSVLSAVKTQAAPPIDASLASSAWHEALKAQAFEDFTTREPAKYETDAYFLYDDKNMYVAYRIQTIVLQRPRFPRWPTCRTKGKAF